VAKSTIQIEFITKHDIRSHEIATQVYQTLVDTSSKLIPEFINWHEPVNIPVQSLDTWLEHWSKPAIIKSELGNSDTDMGMLWSRRRVCRLRGEVEHRHDDQRHGSLIAIEADWHKNIHWEDLFDKLLTILKPEYASLNIISPEEFRCRNTSKYLRAGTLSRLVSWQYEGNWRRPDTWDKEAWNNYRFLPNLAWKTYLSKGFEGCYDKHILEKVCEIQPFNNGLVLKVSERLTSITDAFEAYELQRERVKLAFSDDVFKSD